MYDIVFYRGEVLGIGGIETWLMNLARRYGKTHKMAVLYNKGSFSTLRDIAEHVEVIHYAGQSIKTKKAVFCYDLLGYDTCDSDEYIYVVHADHSKLAIRLDIPKKITKVLSVSEVARQGLLSTIDIDSEVVYNPVYIQPPRKVIKLISGTRLTSEKGLNRMMLLANALDQLGVLYEWRIFTTYDNKTPFSPNVIFRQPTKDLLSYVRDSDYMVQLSDTESYCFSIVEALSVGVPLVVTDLPVLSELGITKKHGVIVPLDTTDYGQYARLIADGGFKFSYSPPSDKWDEVVGIGSGGDYKFSGIKVKNVFGGRVTLMEEGVTLEDGGTTVMLNRHRAESLVERGYLQIVAE